MKHLFLILLFAIIPSLVNADDSLRPKVYLGEFGIQWQSTVEEYQKYVGKTVKYLNGATLIAQHIDEGFIEMGGDFNQEYIITKISKKKEQIVFILKEKGGNKSFKMVVNNKETSYTWGEYRYCITNDYTIPLLLVEKLEEAKQIYIGKQFTPYEVTDVLPYRTSEEYLKDHYNRIYLQLTNKLNNDVIFCEFGDIKLLEKASQYIGKKYSFINKRIAVPGMDKSKNIDSPLFYEIIDFSIIKKENYYTNKIESHLMFKLQNNFDKSVESSKLEELGLFDDLGKVFSNSKFKHYYQVVKVLNKENSVEYVVRNSITGKQKTISKKNAHIVAFSGDLNGHYKAVLTKVEKPQNQSIRYGKTITFTDNGVNKYNYTDNVIDIIILATSEHFIFTVKNLSPNTIKIIWNEAVFIDTDNSTSKIVHKGIQFIQREADQQPTSIIRNAKLEDLAMPTNKIYYSNISNKWTNYSLFSNVDKDNDNQIIKLMLPIEIKGVINEYIFEFTVNYEYDNPDLIRM